LSGESSLLVTSTAFDDDNQAVIENPGQATVAKIAALVSLQAEETPDVQFVDASVQADTRAVAQAELLGQIGALVQNWLASSQPHAREEALARASVAAHADAADLISSGPSNLDGSPKNRRLLSAVQGDFAAAAGLVTVGAVAFGMKRPIRRWWHQPAQLAAPAASPASRRIPFPSSPHGISRVTTRVRKPLQSR
jgi:hypothetical protein